jgi:hypothetical protein
MPQHVTQGKCRAAQSARQRIDTVDSRKELIGNSGLEHASGNQRINYMVVRGWSPEVDSLEIGSKLVQKAARVGLEALVTVDDHQSGQRQRTVLPVAERSSAVKS